MLIAKISMKINSEKKHSVRYDAVDKDAAVTSLYLMKTSVEKHPFPNNITVSVEVETE